MKNTNTYFGGKGSSGTAQTIINQIPKCDVFVETHAGFARITEYMAHKGLIILNDINPETCELLRSKFGSSIIQNEDVTRLYQSFLCCNNLQNVAYAESFINTIKGGVGQGNIIIENLDAEQLLIKYRILFKWFKAVFFCDPPYPLASRKNQKKVYKFEMTDEQHLQFLKAIDSFSDTNKILISTYPNELYSKELQNRYRLIEFYSQTRNGLALENLYCNFEEPTVLNDYSFIGKDYRQREYFKKISRNFIRKFNDFNPQLKNTILERIIAEK